MDKDKKQLMRIAKQRVGFKKHLVTFISVNVFLWVLWFLTRSANEAFPWPIFCTMGWGIAIVSHYFKAYKTSNWLDREYTKLLKEKEDREFWEKEMYKEGEIDPLLDKDKKLD